jgi:hypothetical protein
MSEAHAGSGAEKYVVRPFGHGWRIISDAGPSTVFANSDDAVRAACRVARRTAEEGRLCLVVAETTPQELHCYMPKPSVGAPSPPLPGYVRMFAPGA